jgi:hypothetical protein
MSSVLKALKKLEEERRGEAPSPTAAANQRWASGGQPSRRPRPWLLGIAGLALGLLVALAMVWAGRKAAPVAVLSNPAATPVAPVTTREVMPEQTPTAPPVAAPTVRPDLAKPVTSGRVQSAVLEPGIGATRSSLAPPSSPAPVVESPALIPPPVAPPVRRGPSAVLPEATVQQVQLNRFDIPAPGQQWVAPPQLTVSEIFPPTGGERMAIVNGLPVMAGTMVDEALVEEIHADRVVVLIGGKHVSVPLQPGRSQPAE